MRTLSVCLLILLLAGCQNNSEKNATKKEASTELIIRGEAQGTSYTIKIIDEEREEVANAIKKEMDSLLNAIDQSMSTYLPNSDISRLNNGDTVQLDRMFREVYALSQKIHVETGGTFDPTLGPLIKAWGFDYAEPEKMDTSLVKELLEHIGFQHFEINDTAGWKTDEASRINFNAVAQGYSVDLMTQILDKRAIQNYYVELGGELKVKGKNKFGDWWIIGIDSPQGENLERVLNERISLKNAAMATSGNYRKYYEVDGKKYSHTINPVTGYPAENSLLSATVVVEDCGTADALATAFMVMGVETAKDFLVGHASIQAHLIYTDDSGNFKTFTTADLKKEVIKD